MSLEHKEVIAIYRFLSGINSSKDESLHQTEHLVHELLAHIA